jgi:hypothetical protein
MKNLKTISILYFVLSGLSVLMLLFIPVHYKIMQAIMSMDIPVQPGHPNPKEVFAQIQSVMIYLYIFSGVMSLLFSINSLMTGLYISKRKNRKLAKIGAGISCLMIPLGTALGIFALITLSSDEVVEAFE